MSKDRDLTSLRQELDSIQNLNASFREQLERTHKENSTLTDDNTYLRKKISSLQQENNNSHNECLRLESELYQQGQEVERLKKENVGFLKNKREVERKLREETQAFEKDRVVWQERELELIDQVKALQETVSVLAQQNEQASKRNEDSPPDTPTLGPSHYITVREVKNAQRTIKELEKRNNEITAELDKAKQATTESMNLNKNHVRRIQQLETELSQVKHMHQSLMEENEAFQLLLHEKTMKGEFVLNPIMQRNDSYSEKKNTDIVEKVTNGASKDVKSSSKDNDNLGIFKDSYLAAELNRASVLSTSLLGERVHKESDHTIIESKLQEEIKSLKDANKSMRLYIEKILNRILEAQGFEELLSSEWVKPPASPVTPVTGSFSFNNNNNNPVQEENKSKKIERRKTLSGWHFRSTSQPQNNIKNDTIISEEPEQYLTLRKSNEDTVPSLSDAPRRPQRRNSSSTKNTKRFSLFGGWGSATKEEEKKDDPYMRPMILVQGQGKDRKE